MKQKYLFQNVILEQARILKCFLLMLIKFSSEFLGISEVLENHFAWNDFYFTKSEKVFYT